MATKTKSKKTTRKQATNVRRGPRPLNPDSLKVVLSMVRDRLKTDKDGNPVMSFEDLGEKYGMASQSTIRRMGDLCYKALHAKVQPLKPDQLKMVQTLVREGLISANYAKHGRADQRG